MHPSKRPIRWTSNQLFKGQSGSWVGQGTRHRFVDRFWPLKKTPTESAGSATSRGWHTPSLRWTFPGNFERCFALKMMICLVKFGCLFFETSNIWLDRRLVYCIACLIFFLDIGFVSMRQFGRLMWPTIGVAFVEVQKLLAEMIKSQELMLEIRWDFGGRISCFSRGWVNLPPEVERFASRKVTKKTQQERLVFQTLFDLAAMLSFGRVTLQIEMWTWY